MTTFATEFVAQAWPDLAAKFGETVTYTALGVAGAAITAVWLPNQVLTGYYPDGEQAVSVGVLRASPADVPNPNLEDVVTISGATWAVAAIAQQTPIVEMQLERREQRRLGGTEHTVRR